MAHTRVIYSRSELPCIHEEGRKCIFCCQSRTSIHPVHTTYLLLVPFSLPFPSAKLRRPNFFHPSPNSILPHTLIQDDLPVTNAVTSSSMWSISDELICQSNEMLNSVFSMCVLKRPPCNALVLCLPHCTRFIPPSPGDASIYCVHSVRRCQMKRIHPSMHPTKALLSFL